MQPTLLAEDVFAQIVESVWRTVLDLSIEVVTTPASNDATSDLSVCVPIIGTWNGAVLFWPTARFATKAAAVLFAIPETDVTPSDIQDGMAELGNIVAGNLKSLLPGSSALSLPTVTRGTQHEMYLQRTRLAAQLAFACAGELLSIQLLEGSVPEYIDTHTALVQPTKG